MTFPTRAQRTAAITGAGSGLNHQRRSAAVGADAEAILHLVREKSDAELDRLRRQYVGLD